ncbi:hypothetical protein [Streptacidiphilus sp. MAP5-52]|uniref:hypothetical protein n=1 Tax=Streptacidiphilus sp. MAP5-52 TaxID=3156267 RepID=UPI003514BC16
MEPNISFPTHSLDSAAVAALSPSAGWTCSTGPTARMWDSPCATVRVALLLRDPEPSRLIKPFAGSWIITGAHQALGIPQWRIVFGPRTPLQVVGAVTRILAQAAAEGSPEATVSALSQRQLSPWTLTDPEHGWTSRQVAHYTYLLPPDATGQRPRLEFNSADFDEHEELEGDAPPAWSLVGDLDGPGTGWTGTFTTGTPIMLVTEAARTSPSTRQPRPVTAGPVRTATVSSTPPDSPDAIRDATAAGDLHRFVQDLARRLPGPWDAIVRDNSTSAYNNALSQRLWDLGTAHGALQEFINNHIGQLSHPADLDLIVLPRPGRPDQYLVAALVPSGIGHAVDLEHIDPLPWAIAVPADPARAAADVQRRLLPTYQRALRAIDHRGGLTPLGLSSPRTAATSSGTAGPPVLATAQATPVTAPRTVSATRRR